MISTDNKIPITENCCFAISLDISKKTETIMIGEFNVLMQRLDAFKGSTLLYEKTRDIGMLVMDFVPIAENLADIRAALLDSTGKNKTSFFLSQIKALEEFYLSNNPIHRFTAILLWQEYNRTLNNKNAAESLLDILEDITLALRFNLIDFVKNRQTLNKNNPLEYLDSDFRKSPILLYFSNERKTTEYAMVDRNLLPLAAYYLKHIYDSGRYIQTCPICGKSFVAKTVGMTTLCSEECRRIQGKENKRRFDERTREVSYERAYKNTYMYWYNKVKKCQGMDLPKEKIAKIESAFSSFSKESASRKKQIGRGGANAAEYESWLLTQRNVIDDLLRKLGL